MAISATIFDIDGTLLDTNAAHVEAWVRALRSMGFPINADRIWREVGKGGDQLVPAVLGEQTEREIGEELRRRQRAEFAEIARRTRFPIFPHARDLFSALADRGIRTALATSSNAEHLEALQSSSGFEIFAVADVLVTADDAERSKPSHDIVLAALEKLELSAAECTMIGDTIYDAAACRDTGVICLGVESGGWSAEELLGAGARAVYRDTGEIFDRLDDVLCRASPAPVPLTRELLESLMREALEVAREGLGAGEAPIGAVLARGDGSIVGRAHNRMQATGDLTAHAELAAFREAAGRFPPDTRDLLLVSTLEPCVMCTGAAMETGVETVAYALEAPLDSGTRRLRPPRSPDNQMPRILGGILRGESRALLEEWLRVNGNREQAPYIRRLLGETR